MHRLLLNGVYAWFAGALRYAESQCLAFSQYFGIKYDFNVKIEREREKINGGASMSSIMNRKDMYTHTFK